jgi:membrane protein implicated in regulation of membrane protease activity
MSGRFPSLLFGLLEPLAHLVYVFGIASLVVFAKFLAAAVFALVGFAMLLRLRKWVRRVTQRNSSSPSPSSRSA